MRPEDRANLLEWRPETGRKPTQFAPSALCRDRTTCAEQRRAVSRDRTMCAEHRRALKNEGRV
jgi:hypothetical protein